MEKKTAHCLQKSWMSLPHNACVALPFQLWQHPLSFVLRYVLGLSLQVLAITTRGRGLHILLTAA